MLDTGQAWCSSDCQTEMAEASTEMHHRGAW